MTATPPFPVGISISSSANNICTGSSVTFTAVPTNGGTLPQYQWKINGINAGINNFSYTYSPINGDLVNCVLTSDLTCISNNPATSNGITMTVSDRLPVGISISATPNPFCSGFTVNYNAIPSNEGFSPIYQWKVNGINSGTNSPAFSNTPQSGDSVLCVMTSSLTCVSNNPSISNKIIMVISPPPVVTFTRCFDSITTINSQPIKLKGGIPLGGTYSGPGVSNGYYYPNLAGTGTKIIAYSYTNAAGCSALAYARIINYQLSIINCGSPFTDIRDNKVYPTVQIGSQCWMAANLNYGNMVPSANHQRDNCINEKYCYNELTANCEERGANYQWDELMQYDDTPGLQGFCPPEWHVPTESDWNTLFANYYNSAFAGSPLKYSGYSGFDALLVGVNHLSRQWYFTDFATFFWSSTPYGPYKAWSHGMNDIDPSVSFYPSSRTNAFSVRCLKD